MSKKTNRDPRRQAVIDRKRKNKKLRRLIRTGDDPILTTVCDEIDATSERAKEIADKLLKVVQACDNAVGLAAPQIGENARMILAWPGRFRGEEQVLLMCNPVIVGHSNTMNIQTEGCLSFPGKQAMVNRWDWIEVRWVNLLGKEQWGSFNGWDARVLSHEIEHLGGVCRVGHPELNEPNIFSNGWSAHAKVEPPAVVDKAVVVRHRDRRPSRRENLMAATALAALVLTGIGIR